MTPPQPNFNPDTTAPEAAAARTERHLRQCRILAELGMELATDNAAQAKAKVQAKTQQDPEHRQPDPVLAFTRLARCVQNCITLEDRIANPKAARSPRTQDEADEDRDFSEEAEAIDRISRTVYLTDGLHQTMSDHPNRWNLGQKVEALAKTLLEDNPGSPILPLYEEACEILGLAPNPSRFTPYVHQGIYPDHPHFSSA